MNLCSYGLGKNQLVRSAIQLAKHGSRRVRKKQSPLDEQERAFGGHVERVSHVGRRHGDAKALLGVRRLQVVSLFYQPGQRHARERKTLETRKQPRLEVEALEQNRLVLGAAQA